MSSHASKLSFFAQWKYPDFVSYFPLWDRCTSPRVISPRSKSLCEPFIRICPSKGFLRVLSALLPAFGDLRYLEFMRVIWIFTSRSSFPCTKPASENFSRILSQILCSRASSLVSLTCLSKIQNTLSLVVHTMISHIHSILQPWV